MMRTIYLFLIIVTTLSCCKSVVRNDCTFQDTNIFSFFNDSISITMPVKLLKNRDTINHDFEINKRLLYTTILSTDDSLSSAFITVEDYGNYSMINRDVVNNLIRLKNVQLSMMKHNENDYFFERYDTLNGRMSGEIILEGKRGDQDITTGGITFYYNKKRIEIIVMLNGKNFNDLRNRLKCMLSSVQYTN
ncbi:MAG TPA: hypothetical protein VIZ28_09765 [Chitinophagaceae bacterium]